MAPLAGTSDTMEVIGAVGGSVTFHIPNADRNTDANAALWYFGNKPIVTVEFKAPFQPEFHKPSFENHFAVSESDYALTISELRMEDAGTYSVVIGDKRSTFTLHVFGELAEPTVTCETQNGSDGSFHHYLHCSVPGTDCRNVSYTWDQPRAEGSKLLVNESSWDNLEPPTCTAKNPVSSRNVTVPNLRELCTGNSTHPPRPGAHSGIWMWIVLGIAVVGVVFLSICLMCYCKSKVVLWMKGRCRSSAGHQGESHSVTGDHLMDSERQAEDSDGEPEVDQPFGAVQD